jgi:hypothetical protein
MMVAELVLCGRAPSRGEHSGFWILELEFEPGSYVPVLERTQRMHPNAAWCLVGHAREEVQRGGAVEHGAAMH